MRPVILLVDPDTDTRAILRAYLEHAGFSVLDAGAGQEALDLARAHAPDLIIGDFPLDVPGHSPSTGAVAKELGREAPVLTVTARATGEEVEVARAVSQAVLTKPVAPRAVLEEVERLLKRP